MAVQSCKHLDETIASLDILSSLFLTLPDENLVTSIMSGTFQTEADSAGLDEIARFGQSQQGRDTQDILLDLARDRARLIRGVDRGCIEPPYESLYIGQQSNTTIGSLNNFYERAGYTVDQAVKDAPDQLGIELAFAKLILEQERSATDQGDLEKATEHEALYHSFLSQHLKRWASTYATNMADAAQTGFYRGVALLLKELLA